MSKKITNMRGMVKGFANAVNLISPDIPMHHQQVAYLSYHIADEMGYSEESKLKIIYCALLHDVGSTVMPEKDKDGWKITYKIDQMAEAGVSLLGETPRFRFIRLVLTSGKAKLEENVEDEELKTAIIFHHIIKLADNVSGLIDHNRAALNQVTDICDEISELAGDEILPEVVESFLRVSKREFMWMNLMYEPDAYLAYIPDENNVTVDDAIEYTRIASRVIDYRSMYTAMHSSGVAASAVRLAELIGMSEDECKMIMIAGYLHDIGKLKVPRKILEKSGKLTDDEFNAVKEHAYFTNLLIKDIPGFEQIRLWASLHHEKLNGNGYPFGLSADDIPMGARIMAVADIFSAVAEIRPYRAGMSKERVIEVLKENVMSGALSGYIVDLMINHYDDVYAVRDAEVRAEGARYYAATACVGDDDDIVD